MKKYNEYITEETVAGNVAAPSGQLMGKPYFKVSHDTYLAGLQGKIKRKRWLNHLNKSDEAKSIQQFAKKHKGQFFLQSTQTNSYVPAHRMF